LFLAKIFKNHNIAQIIKYTYFWFKMLASLLCMYIVPATAYEGKKDKKEYTYGLDFRQLKRILIKQNCLGKKVFH
jgi:hypothetical protein